jgi:hypothetical protein
MQQARSRPYPWAIGQAHHQRKCKRYGSFEARVNFVKHKAQWSGDGFRRLDGFSELKPGVPHLLGKDAVIVVC